MKVKQGFTIIIAAVLIICAGCSKALIKNPLAASNERWQMTLSALTLGPDQYNTAGGYWEPRDGKRFVWATIRICNALNKDQQFLLERIMLTISGKQVKPFIMDMDSAVTMRANPVPKLAPGETVSRRLIYIVPKGIIPEKISYEKNEIALPLIK